MLRSCFNILTASSPPTLACAPSLRRSTSTVSRPSSSTRRRRRSREGDAPPGETSPRVFSNGAADVLAWQVRGTRTHFFFFYISQQHPYLSIDEALKIDNDITIHLSPQTRV